MKKIKIILILSTLVLSFQSLTFAGLFSDDYRVENVPGGTLNKKYISEKYRISILFPSNWSIVPKSTKPYSVVKIRSEDGGGLESINIVIIPLGNKKEYSINDIENQLIPDFMTPLGSGYTEICGQKALWYKLYVDNTDMASKEGKGIFDGPASQYRVIKEYSCIYQVKFIKDNNFYQVTCGALDNTKERVLKRFENNIDLFMSMVQSFSV